MNKILNKIVLISLLAVVMAACGKEDPFEALEEGTGLLSIKKMMVHIENEENVVRAPVDVSSFIVDILQNNEVIASYKYSDMPEVITLSEGDYMVGVRSGDLEDVAWDTPYFEGSTECTIKSKEITELETVTCKLSNVRVSIIFDDTLMPVLGDDTKVTVEMGDGVSIDFTKNETRSAYFAYLPGSTTLVATFRGSINNDKYEELKAYTDVKPGNHYKITYSYSESEVPGNEGKVDFKGLYVDATVEEVNLTYKIDVEEPTLDDDKRPGQGGSVNPPTPPTEVGPDIEVPNGSKIDINGNVVDIVDGETYTLKVTSETGFTVFKVDIVSPYLTDSFMAGINFTTHLDFVNPGQYEENFKGFGLPYNVGGSKEELFDISNLVPLLFMDDEKGRIHEFHLTVADASGSVTKIMKFRN